MPLESCAKICSGITTGSINSSSNSNSFQLSATAAEIVNTNMAKISATSWHSLIIGKWHSFALWIYRIYGQRHSTECTPCPHTPNEPWLTQFWASERGLMHIRQHIDWAPSSPLLQIMWPAVCKFTALCVISYQLPGRQIPPERDSWNLCVRVHVRFMWRRQHEHLYKIYNHVSLIGSN